MATLEPFFTHHAPPADAAPAALTGILESITDAVFLVDRHWRFTYLNHQAEVLLCQPRAALCGRTIWEAFPEAVGTVFDEQYHRALHSGMTAQSEAYYAPLATWVEVRAYPSAAGLAVFCHDITARRTAEATQQASAAVLAAAQRLAHLGS